MARLVPALLLFLLGCSAPPPPALSLGFAGGPDGPRLRLGGVTVGDEAAEAAALLGPGDSLFLAPGGALARVRWTARAGRVDSLWLTLEGSPPALMRARLVLARAAMRAGLVCGPDGCALRGGEGVVVKVASVLSWPTRVEAADAGPPRPRGGPRIAVLEVAP
ncbi:MAG: hypothetical protein QM704_23850 [Anaeromyxobacteraceae bacterium]